MLSPGDEARIDSLVAQMTLDEKASLTGGADVWHLPAVARLGIASIKMSDGPSGVRGQHHDMRRSLSFPCGMAVGATWNVELASRYGSALAEEALAKGVHVLLGPTVGIPRTPFGGRVFESFAEDPKLSAAMAVAYIRGAQGDGVACCVKHFACNDQEFERMTISAELSERTLREVHLAPFEAAVLDAEVLSVMSAYNRVAGIYCSEHPDLLGRILKREWGFEGAVISDWLAAHSTVDAATAGLDVEMPGPPRYFGAPLADAVRAHELGGGVLDEQVRRILRIAAHTGALDHPTRADEPQDPSDPSRRALARELAVDATVLLANDGVLPLDPSLRSIVVIGPSGDRLVGGGGGSSKVLAHRAYSLVSELRDRFPGATVVHEPGCSLGDEIPPIDPQLLGEGMRLDYFNGEFSGDVAHRDTLLTGSFVAIGDPAPGVGYQDFSIRATTAFRPDRTGPWQLALSATGRARVLLDGEVLLDNADSAPGKSFYGLGSEQASVVIDLVAGRDHTLVTEIHSTQLPLAGFELAAAGPQEDNLMQRAVDAAARADVAIVVVGSSGTSETEGADRTDLRLIGDQDELVERIIVANPRTIVVLNIGAPVETPWAAGAAAVLNCWYPGEEGAPALAQILAGEVDPGGRLPITFPARLEDNPTHGEWYPGTDGRVTYGEGVFVGYRHYDARGIEPAFAFGHGLSYSSFAYGAPRVDVEGRRVRVSLSVTNTGVRAGRDVVQLYVREVSPSVERPEKELKAFEKIHLAPGATAQVSFDLEERDFSFWDEQTHGWTVKPGDFEVVVGASSRDLRHRATIAID